MIPIWWRVSPPAVPPPAGEGARHHTGAAARQQTGAARFVEVPGMGHTFQHYLSFADAFHDKAAEFDPKVLQLVTDWLKQHATHLPGSSVSPEA